MSKKIILVILLISSMAIGGCGLSSKEIKAKAQSERTDVFTEVRDKSKPSKDYADLIIKASIKTHFEGYHVYPEKSLHGDPLYPFVVNVDGQGILWEVEGKKEKTSVFDDKGERMPEGGEGMRYTLNKTIRLSAGPHTIFFGLPGDIYGDNFQIVLKEGEQHILECKPIYRLHQPSKKETVPGSKRSGGRNVRSFIHGVSECTMLLNSATVK